MRGGDKKQAGSEPVAQVIRLPQPAVLMDVAREPGLLAKVLRTLALMWHGAGFAAMAWWVSVRPIR
jgi:hypothetical protein